MNKKSIYETLIKILEKKAGGFYYTEEIDEYEKTQNKLKSTQKQLNFFDNNENFILNDRVENNLTGSYDTIKSQDENTQNKDQGCPELTLVKKKIATHYIPPDMLAIKTLLEIYGQKIKTKTISKMTNQELMELKKKLIGEILDEDCKNI